jgi:hypothetical protein
MARPKPMDQQAARRIRTAAQNSPSTRTSTSGSATRAQRGADRNSPPDPYDYDDYSHHD